MWAVPCEVPLAPIAAGPLLLCHVLCGPVITLQLLLFADRAGPFFLETFSCAISKPHHRLTPFLRTPAHTQRLL